MAVPSPHDAPGDRTLLRDVALLDADGERPGWLLIDGARIAATGTEEAPEADVTVDGRGRRLTPGFVDLHVHGGGGAAFDGDDLAATATALDAHARGGTTRTLVGLVSGPLDLLVRSLTALRELVGTRGVVGVHLEGPFLSPARRGAHAPEALILPTPDAVDRLLDAGAGVLRQITIAPELPGALAAIERFSAAGMLVAVGHTEADYDLTREAFAAGAVSLTHAFNAMPGLAHRAPGPVAAAVDDGAAVLELVLDGWHVHPAMARVLFRLAPGRVALVTDAMAAAGAEDGEYRLGDLRVTVADGVARLTGTDTLASSTLTTSRELGVAVAVGVDPVAAVTALTVTPARFLGLERTGLLRPDSVADLVLLDDDWSAAAVWRDGRPVS